MKILLIQPPFTIFKTEPKTCHPPLGLAYLAGMLKGRHNVMVMDALAEGYSEEEVIDKEFIRYGLSFENIKERIKSLMPDVIGISCLFTAQAGNAHAICGLIKEIDKKIITVLGGAYPSSMPRDVLSDSNVDFVIIGEGEGTFSRLLESIENKDDVQVENIDGLGFRQNGEVKINQKKNYRIDLDSLPFPYWDVFPLKEYFRINKPHGGPARNTPFLPVSTSRGCPFRCVFCSVHTVWGRDYRKRSAENVLKELDYIVNRFSIKEVLFEDDNLTLDKERVKEIFNGMIDKGINVRWSVPNGVAVQTLDNGMLELMKESGCYSISIGVESGDGYILRNTIEKPIMLETVKDVIDKARKIGLDTTAFFVVGFPGETHLQLKNTFRFAENLGADNIIFFFATPLPGTRLLELCREKGLINGDLDYARLKSDHPVFATETFSICELRSIVLRERMKLYLLYLLKNPKKFMHKLWYKLLRDPGSFMRFGLKHFGIRHA